MKYFQFKALFQKEGWLSPAYVGTDKEGTIQYLSDQKPDNATEIELVEGFAIPGFQNGHSHAFQYAMCGIAERHDGTEDPDDFWTWRDAMYKVALSIDPDQMEAVATMLYVEMLRMGYTHVAEFHYLHHDKEGKPYSNLAEMGERLLAAAQRAGIKITLIPVFYQKGGFGKEAEAGQRRFISKTPEEYQSLLESSKKAVRNYQKANWAASVHSLRAVEPSLIKNVFQSVEKGIPLHMHIAEQLKEVEDCMNYLKMRPVEWVLRNLEPNEDHFFVHATHMNEEEVKSLAQSGSTVVLCPSTEGNLGDGIFRLKEFQQWGGRWTIGTDSQINLNPIEDLRLLDYGQRTKSHKRNTFYEAKQPDSAAYALERVVLNGRRSVKQFKESYFAIGMPLDALVINARHPLYSVRSFDYLLSTILYCSDPSHYLGTMVNAEWMILAQRHSDQEGIYQGFTRCMSGFSII